MRRDDGAIAILVAFFAVVLFGIAALVIDIGSAQDARTQSQAAVDDAALAGARVLATGGNAAAAAFAVKEYVAENLGDVDWSGCADPDHLPVVDPADPTDECVSQQAIPAPGGTTYQVRVKLPPRQITTTLSGIFGVGSITVSPVAAAKAGVLPPCQPCDPPLNSGGTPIGSPSPSPTPTYTPSPTPTPSPSATPSPAPSPSATPSPTATPTPACLAPGTFDSDVDIAGSACLDPGLYVFHDAKFVVGGALSGSNATLVFEGTGTMAVQGALSLQATPADDPAVAGEIPGVALFFTAGDTQPFDLGGSFHISGNLYALDAVWHADPGDCAAVGQCVLSDGVLSVAGTDFDGSDIPNVGNGEPTPAPSPVHLYE